MDGVPAFCLSQAISTPAPQADQTASVLFRLPVSSIVMGPLNVGVMLYQPSSLLSDPPTHDDVTIPPFVNVPGSVYEFVIHPVVLTVSDGNPEQPSDGFI